MSGQIERLSNANSVMYVVRKLKIPLDYAVKVYEYFFWKLMKSELIFEYMFFLVCDYYVHEACQEFAVPSCVEKATYDATKTLCDARNATTHHFQVHKC